MIMQRNLEVKTQLQASFTTILLIESEITFMSVFASPPLVKNSEIVSENSLLFSINVLLIGFYHGHNKPWFPLQTRSYQVSNNWTQQPR